MRFFKTFSAWTICFVSGFVVLCVRYCYGAYDKKIPLWAPFLVFFIAIILRIIFNPIKFTLPPEKVINQRAINDNEKKLLEKERKSNVAMGFIFIAAVLIYCGITVYLNGIKISGPALNYFASFIIFTILFSYSYNFSIAINIGKDIETNNIYKTLWKDYYLQIPFYVKFEADGSPEYKVDAKTINQNAEVEFCPHTKYILSLDGKSIFAKLSY